MAAMQEAENKMAIAAHKKVKSHFLSSKESLVARGRERERRIHVKHFAKLLWPLFDGSALQGQSHCDAPRNRPKFGTPTFSGHVGSNIETSRLGEAGYVIFLTTLYDIIF
jgi:hypothetical protein